MLIKQLVKLPKDSFVHVTIHPPAGNIPNRTIYFFGTEKVLDITRSRKVERPAYIETRGMGKYGKMHLESAFGFDPDGTQRPLKFSLPDWLERDIKSGTIEVHLWLDTGLALTPSQQAIQKISSVIEKNKKM